MERREALQQAIDEISRQRAEIERLRRGTRDPIAIVGMACRLPGAASVEEFWELLARGGDAVGEVPRDRWNAEAFYDADPSAVGKMVTRQGAFIRGVDQFDPRFFGIAPREAQSMDPQQRLLLEVAWEALEDATIAPTDLYGSSTGVFVGITCFDHAIRVSQAAENFNAYAGTGSALNMAPGRLSYVLGLTGPSMAVDTACSSSLVCLHLACQSLRDRESTMAIVGGVHLILSPHVMVSFSQARMLAPDGRSKTFDASADGYSRGEGCGVVVLKRYADAVADGDRILGLIRGTAVNQDGPGTGLTVPNGASQQQVIRRALASGGVAPTAVSYVEAHGTGTPLGDPIEVEALARVYGEGRSPGHPLLVGSVKTNIGHLEPAAGVAGLIKLLLAFRHGEIPRHLHFRTPNPHIPWSTAPVQIVGSPVAWPRTGVPRIAGLSAFGFSGTNAHVIVEEPPAPEPSAPAGDRRRHLLPISAKSETALRELAKKYHSVLVNASDRDLASIAYTAGIGRAHFPHRLVVLAETARQAAEALGAFLAGTASPDARAGKAADAGYRRDAADVQARLTQAYNQRALDEIATLYLEGVAIAWARLHDPARPARVPLPAHPFERQRYWVDTPDDTATPQAAPWFYELVWTRLGPAAPLNDSGQGRRWTVVPGDPALAEQVTQLLRQRGAPVSTAPFAQAAEAPETDIIVTAGADGAHDCVGLLGLVQALLTAGGASPRIWVVTRGAVPVAGGMTPAGARQAPLAAFARVLGLEHPELFGRLIDLERDASAGDAAALVAEILFDDIEDQVALRQGSRYGQRVDRLAVIQTPPAGLRDDAVYLVTGGLGRIGLLVARDLVRRGARRLCLLGRSGVSSDGQRSAVAALEAMGAAVRIAMADVADAAALSAVMRDLERDAPLAGVVHAAGLPGYTDVARLTAAQVTDVLRPKIDGAWHLHELTRDRPLDFFVCFSSIASAWGSRGQAHYAAGNAFLDALAYLRRAEGLPAVTINWGPWVEGGMTTPEAATLLRRVGIRPLPTADAVAALAAVATGDRAQVVIADVDWALFKGSYEARGHRRILERLSAAAGVPDAPAENALAREVVRAAPHERERLLTGVIAQEVAAVLELASPADADPGQGLFEMGLDSLMALDLRTRLQTLIGRTLPATLVFDYPTIRAIARFLSQELAGSAAAAGPESGAAADLDALSDAEAEARLLKKLESIR